MQSRRNLWPLSGLVLLLIGCQNTIESIQVFSLLNTSISLPTEILLYSDQGLTHLDKVRDGGAPEIIIHYREEDCHSCLLTELAEKLVRVRTELGEDTKIKIILSLSEKQVQGLCDIIYYLDFRMPVYFDINNEFDRDNRLLARKNMRKYHYFLINDKGKIICVGNPFSNEQVLALYKKRLQNS